MTYVRATVLALAFAGLTQSAHAFTRGELDALIAAQAAANGVPVALVHRVVIRESRYNPRLVGRGGAMGLMQIKAATARGVGYTGGAAGLLDPQTNLTYAVRYLAGAYRLAHGNADRAVSYYAHGYYYAAKGKGQTVQALATPAQDSFALVPAVTTAKAPAHGQRVAAAVVVRLPDPNHDRD